MGDLIRMPYSEVTATMELLDRLGVSPHDFEVLRKASSWSQGVIGRIHRTDPFLWAMLEMEETAARAGFCAGDFRTLAGNEDMLRQIRAVVRGEAEVRMRMLEHLINCDADPFIPDGWSVHEEDQLQSRVRGMLEWNPAKVALYLTEEQKAGFIKGNKLRELLADKPVLNANVLDYLLAHPHLIPEEWKGKWVFFWGTIYRGPFGGFCVRCPYWDGGRWHWFYRWLDGDWRDYGPAALGA